MPPKTAAPSPDDINAFYAWTPDETREKMDAMTAWVASKKLTREDI